VIRTHRSRIADEVLADRMDAVEGVLDGGRDWNINGETLTLAVERREPA
jgi:hypothetical protein